MDTDENGYGKETDESVRREPSGDHDPPSDNDSPDIVERRENRWGMLKFVAKMFGYFLYSLTLDVVIKVVPYSPWVDTPTQLLFVLIGAFFALPWMLWLSQQPYESAKPTLEERFLRHALPICVFILFALGGSNVATQLNASFDHSPIEPQDVEVQSVSVNNDIHTFQVSSWRGGPSETLRWREGWPDLPSVSQGGRLRLATRHGRFGLAWVSGATPLPPTTEPPAAAP